MAHLGTITKQPDEKLPYDVDYTDVLGGRTGSVATPTTTVSGTNAPVVSDTSLTGKVFQFYLAGGLNGGTHTLTLTTSITVGGKVEIVQDEITILVEEIT